MPQFAYRGRDKQGALRVGEREADTPDTLNNELIKEGIFPLSITLATTKQSMIEKINDWLQGRNLQLGEMAVFTRQMQLLQDAGVPTATAINQLIASTRSQQLVRALRGLTDYIEKGQSLSAA